MALPFFNRKGKEDNLNVESNPNPINSVENAKDLDMPLPDDSIPSNKSNTTDTAVNQSNPIQPTQPAKQFAEQEIDDTPAPSNTSLKSSINTIDPALNPEKVAESLRQNPKINTGSEGELKFYIDLRPKLLNLKSFPNKQETDLRYSLMPPFAFAHIYWSSELNEVIYSIEEPSLDEAEKEVLGLIQLALEEMINVSFIRATKTNLIMDYLENNVKSILIELGLQVSNESYQKIMYIVYRDSVGLNEIEPLLNDYYIEDIESNGVNFPIYIVHRKYGTLRTNITLTDFQKATDFVEKLAQKCGRYVSYAKPLLDGTLPDGSRVNATYTDDVTTRGPTFTIRKFTKEPWTPVHLIKYKTASAEAFAFLWFTIEHKSNIMLIGETGSGKTTLLNALAYFIPPESRICSIEDTRELNLVHDNWLPAVSRTGFGIPNILGEQYGEITLFDLLKETFRQNPDYVILGETRGKETYVLFQGMASGHPSFSTFHAASVETLVRRLETPPINLPASLIESIDLVLAITHAKDVEGEEKNMRRLKEVAEIISVKQELGQVQYNDVFEWNPIKDEVFKNEIKSHLLDKISKRIGLSTEKIEKEIQLRTKLLAILAEKNITDFRKVSDIIHSFYKQKQVILKEYGVL